MCVADSSPLAFTASMNSGKISDGTICAGWRIVRLTERLASVATWVASDGVANRRAGAPGAAAIALISRGRASRLCVTGGRCCFLLLVLTRPLERAPRLGEEH